jgi:hypothetical protein
VLGSLALLRRLNLHGNLRGRALPPSQPPAAIRRRQRRLIPPSSGRHRVVRRERRDWDRVVRGREGRGTDRWGPLIFFLKKLLTGLPRGLKTTPD